MPLNYLFINDLSMRPYSRASSASQWSRSESALICSGVLPRVLRHNPVHARLDLEKTSSTSISISGDLACVPAAGWWIMISALGSAMRLPRFAPEDSRNAPIDAAIPTQMVDTSHLDILHRVVDRHTVRDGAAGGC